MPEQPIIVDCHPKVVLQPGDFGRILVATETLQAVHHFLQCYAAEASKKLHACGKVNCECFREDVRYMLGAEEAAIDITMNLKRAFK